MQQKKGLNYLAKLGKATLIFAETVKNAGSEPFLVLKRSYHKSQEKRIGYTAQKVALIIYILNN